MRAVVVVGLQPRIQVLLEGIEVAGGEQVTLATIDELKPAVVRGVDSDDFLYLIMPVRVS